MLSTASSEPLRPLIEAGFDIEWLSHARAIFHSVFPDCLTELVTALSGQTLPVSEVVGSGGGETKFTQRLRRRLADLGWVKHRFVIEKIVDGVRREATSHEVDHVRRFDTPACAVACEIEWNNKDTFFDRDFENFKRLHVEGAISAGVVITRGRSLQGALTAAVRKFAEEQAVDGFEALARLRIPRTERQSTAIQQLVAREATFQEAWVQNFVRDKFGMSTTHWDKLHERVQRGVANPCPVLLIGLPASILVDG